MLSQKPFVFVSATRFIQYDDPSLVCRDIDCDRPCFPGSDGVHSAVAIQLVQGTILRRGASGVACNDPVHHARCRVGALEDCISLERNFFR